jgi:hypothetical protein
MRNILPLLFFALLPFAFKAQYKYIPTVTPNYVVFETPYIQVDKTQKKIVIKPDGAYNFALPFSVKSTSYKMAIDFTFAQNTESGSIGFDLYMEGGEKITYLISEKGRLKLLKSPNSVSKDMELTPWVENQFINKGLDSSNRLEVYVNNTSIDFYINKQKWYSTGIKNSNLGYIAIQNSKIVKHFTINYIEFSIKPELRQIKLPSKITGYEAMVLSKEINEDSLAQITPIISADEKNLYFVRKIGLDRIYHSKSKGANQWEKARLMGNQLNPPSASKSIISTNTDGSVVFLKGSIKNGQHYEGGITRLAKQPNGEWGTPEYRYIDNYLNINEYKTNHLSNDERYLIQCLDYSNGYGDQDVHVSIRKENGHYGTPINLGPIINSAGNESFAFIAPDNKTLYFSSKGLPGYGSNDIYMSKRLDDTWQQWSTPVNLGPNINSTRWDGYFSTSASGKIGLISSSNNRTKSAIYWVKLPEDLMPDPVLLLSGYSYELNSKNPISTEVTFTSLTNGVTTKVQTNAETGTYSLVLIPGHKYEIIAQKEGYYPIADFMDLSSLNSYKALTKNLFLAPIKVGLPIRLNNLFFETAKFDLLQDSYIELNRLVAFMKEKPMVKIEIAGHTDAVGDTQRNLELSENRAKSVKSYLISKGIQESRIQVIGYGKTKPIADNSSEEGKAKNRRVEFVILE